MKKILPSDFFSVYPQCFCEYGRLFEIKLYLLTVMLEIIITVFKPNSLECFVFEENKFFFVCKIQTLISKTNNSSIHHQHQQQSLKFVDICLKKYKATKKNWTFVAANKNKIFQVISSLVLSIKINENKSNHLIIPSNIFKCSDQASMIVMYKLSQRNLFKIFQLQKLNKKDNNPCPWMYQCCNIFFTFAQFCHAPSGLCHNIPSSLPLPKGCFVANSDTTNVKNQRERGRMCSQLDFPSFLLQLFESLLRMDFCAAFFLFWRDVEKPACSDGKLSGFFFGSGTKIFLNSLLIHISECRVELLLFLVSRERGGKAFPGEKRVCDGERFCLFACENYPCVMLPFRICLCILFYPHLLYS